MDRKAFNQCISSGFKTYKKELEEYPQPLKFCSIAKLCASRAKDLKEAILVCSQPRESKESSGKGISVQIRGKTRKLSLEEYARICPCEVERLKKENG